MRTLRHRLACTVALLFGLETGALAQGTVFTYQGRLATNGIPVSGLYDLSFTVYDAPVSGGEVAGPLTNSAVAVSNGLFTTTIDFGPGVFNGIDLWLGIQARPAGGGAFTALTPLQRITSAPYAIYAGTATRLDGSVSTEQLPPSVVTNGAKALTLTGTFTGNGASLSNVNALSVGGVAASNLWRLTGNNVGANQFLGSTNNADVVIRVNNEPAMRLSYRSNVTHGVAPSVIGGHKQNSASVILLGNTNYVGATIAGGGTANAPNFVLADLGTVSGGVGNVASGVGAFVGGGTNNVASGDYSAVVGGVGNRASSRNSVAMGQASTASGWASTAMGNSIASEDASTAMGNSSASGTYSTAMGVSSASGRASIAMGQSTASADHSFAGGTFARSTHAGSFVWADSTQDSFYSKAGDSFNIRANGGLWLADSSIRGPTDLYFGSIARQMVNLFGTNYAIGVQSSTTYFRSNSRFSWFRLGSHSDAQNDPGAGGTVLMTLNNAGLTVNGTFVSASDRNKKENFQLVDAQAVLEKVVALPLSEWNYKEDEERSRHLGPMAQDFRAAFHLGADDKHIATVDADGVALAAIQGLNQKVSAENAELRAENANLKQRLAALEKAVSTLLKK